MELTEKEKMIAGKLYFAGDPELVADRRDARLRLRAINQESDREKREEFVKQAFGGTKNHVYVELENVIAVRSLASRSPSAIMFGLVAQP